MSGKQEVQKEHYHFHCKI